MVSASLFQAFKHHGDQLGSYLKKKKKFKENLSSKD